MILLHATTQPHTTHMTMTIAPANTCRVTFTAHLRYGYRGYTALLTNKELIIEDLTERDLKYSDNNGRYEVYGFVMLEDGSLLIQLANDWKIHARVVITPDIVLSLLPDGLTGDVSHVDKCWLPWA